MGASDLIGRLALAGVHLSVDGEDLIAAPSEAITDELRSIIRDNKLSLLAALGPVEAGWEFRRQTTAKMLADDPEKKRVAIFNTDSFPGVVLCTIAIRDVGTCELRIPADQYDPWAILAAPERTQ